MSASISCMSCPHCGKEIKDPEQLYYVRFIGGAANGVTLDLANVPMLLRVVIDKFGNVDALDAEGDEPREGEAIYYYHREEKLGWIHFKESPSHSNEYGANQTGFVMTADYYPHHPQKN